MRALTHLGGLVPLALLLWDGAHNDLTANPIQEITQRTGKTALVLLALTLAVTPVNRVLGVRQVVPLRRPLGLYAFFYLCLHLLTFTVLDYWLDLELIAQAIAEKPYVLVGVAAFTVLVPLAITSTKNWMRRLGRRWRVLHRLVYVAAALGVTHYYLVVKADVREPLLYGAIIAGLLVLRFPPLRRVVARIRVRRLTRPARLPQPSRGS
ncbi:MAG: sulfoxide reductase heme-binding subunit YedZ [Chloroflexi bacterium]|nr:sulfoxide reductase heme-binding subunit YedZ [Chloroflexota bacterium]